MIGQAISGLFENEFIKLLVSGMLSGLIAHFMSIRLFGIQRKIETRREFQLKRLEALRDLRLTLHCWETLFLHDQEMSSTLRKLYSLVGASHEEFYGNSKIFQKPLGQMIIEIQSDRG